MVNKLEEALRELEEIVASLRSSANFDVAYEQLARWKQRTVKIIEKYLSPEEAKKFDKKHLMVFHMGAQMENFTDEVELYKAHISVLKDEITKNPEFYAPTNNTEVSETTTVPAESTFGRIEKICRNFNKVARQLRSRHQNRATLEVNDEYDVQDLLHALLKVDFDDVRAEEWTPSFAGACSRTDFLLKKEKVVIEVKKTGSKTKDKEIGEQLLIDIARYKTHPDCKQLVCFVYDPEGLVGNPNGLIDDLEKSSNELPVTVIIEPVS